MKSTTEIIELLRFYKATHALKYGFTRMGIFGSVARGEQTEQSDIDICYEGNAPSLLTLDRIQTELEDLLGSPVDLVRVRDRMNAGLKKRIMKEGIYV
ncbi:nucleotidyltransferase family protein [Bacteroides salyersiae]|jgi:predicted nucleotidyltransferase|uniref:nucleotidyltransferase family protein n=1 Tax=Bacteroides salyersiae TaxID=291644 RepID=UPI001C8BEA65|nr:nucleotidyltransferase family protein [Bacteroides salyersiae]